MALQGIEAPPGSTANGSAQSGSISGATKFIVGLGVKDGGASEGWNGLIDDVRLYERVLTPAEVQALAATGTTGADDNGNGIPDECECIGDIDDDGVVGVSDLLALLASWGSCPGCNADLDGDDVVGVTDMLGLLAAWGPCP